MDSYTSEDFAMIQENNSQEIVKRIDSDSMMHTSDKNKPKQIVEDILTPSPNRYVLFPIRYQDIWAMYQKAVASFWTPDEIDFKGDTDHWNSLTRDEQHFIKHVLAFFAASDFIVNENLVERFMKDVPLAEAQCFYGFQVAIENIHSHTYALLLDTYIKDPKEKDHCVNAVQTIPCIAKKAEWAQKWIHCQESTFARRLVGFVIVEGLFFSGAFCAIYWLKKRGLLHGLTFSNELISRDEGLHTEFGCLLYSKLQSKLTAEEVYQVMREAVDIELEFINDALPCRLIGMNADQMGTYIRFVADRLLILLGYEKLFNAANPFDFMQLQSLSNKQNFFEGRVSNYSRAFVGNNESDKEFGLDADF